MVLRSWPGASLWHCGSRWDEGPGQLLMRGAFIQFMQTGLIPIPVPNVIIFQFNPETITHAWTPAQTPEAVAAKKAPQDPLAVKGLPGESFTFSLAMDAGDTIAERLEPAASVALVSGVASRLAALEMLLFPEVSGHGSLLGTASASISFGGLSLNGSAEVKRGIPACRLPTVLFVWGPGRIVPVKVQSLSITEKLYHPLTLAPTHADAQLTLKVLTPEELESVRGLLADVAKATYVYTSALREALAIANLGNAADSIIGMLPA